MNEVEQATTKAKPKNKVAVLYNGATLELHYKAEETVEVGENGGATVAATAIATRFRSPRTAPDRCRCPRCMVCRPPRWVAQSAY